MTETNPRPPAEELCTVDYAAELLQLHPKTVLRYIREGRLKATRLGKSYRIVRSDLESLAGLPPAPAPRPPSVTCIVDVPGVGPALAQKWARAVPNALHSKPVDSPPLHAEVLYEADRMHLKIFAVGSARDVMNLLGLMQVWLEQLKP